jgi:putative copper export protein
VSLLTFVLAAGHALAAAVWFGAMAYSLVVVQPRAARLLGADRYEELAAVLASGARWSVLGMAAVLTLSGTGLVGAAYSGRDPSGPWLAIVAAKAVLLVAALAVFSHVSWVLWPRRLFALPEELPAMYRAFRRAAYTLLTLVGAECVLGVAARTLTGS